MGPDGQLVTRKADGTMEKYEGADRSLLGVWFIPTNQMRSDN